MLSGHYNGEMLISKHLSHEPSRLFQKSSPMQWCAQEGPGPGGGGGGGGGVPTKMILIISYKLLFL